MIYLTSTHRSGVRIMKMYMKLPSWTKMEIQMHMGNIHFKLNKIKSRMHPSPHMKLIRLQKQGCDWTKYMLFMRITWPLSPFYCICLSLSLWGSDTHCCSPCISSTLTLSCLNILIHFISFCISTTPHFVYLLLSGNYFCIVYSSLSLCMSWLLSLCLSLTVSPLIKSSCYGLKDTVMKAAFLVFEAWDWERATQRPCDPWCWAHRGSRLWS